MVVAPYGRNGTLRHPTEGSYKGYCDDQQHHNLRINLCKYQDQEAPWNFLQNWIHRPDNCMDTLKVILDSINTREGMLPTTSQPPHGVPWEKQQIGLEQFWHFYAVNALGLRINSLHQPIFWALHTSQTPRKRGRYRSQWHRGAHQDQGDRQRRPGPRRWHR